jgi:hypothetical protein
MLIGAATIIERLSLSHRAGPTVTVRRRTGHPLRGERRQSAVLIEDG